MKLHGTGESFEGFEEIDRKLKGKKSMLILKLWSKWVLRKLKHEIKTNTQ